MAKKNYSADLERRTIKAIGREVEMTINVKGPSIEMLRAILKAFNAHDLDLIMSFFAEDCVLVWFYAEPRPLKASI